MVDRPERRSADRQVRERHGRSVARLVLALLLLAMATGQLADVPGFVDVLRAFTVAALALAHGASAVRCIIGYNLFR